MDFMPEMRFRGKGTKNGRIGLFGWQVKISSLTMTIIVVLIDSREQQPYTFAWYGVETMRTTLPTGGYFVRGFHDKDAYARERLDEIARGRIPLKDEACGGPAITPGVSRQVWKQFCFCRGSGRRRIPHAPAAGKVFV